MRLWKLMNNLHFFLQQNYTRAIADIVLPCESEKIAEFIQRYSKENAGDFPLWDWLWQEKLGGTSVA